MNSKEPRVSQNGIVTNFPEYVDRELLGGRHGWKALDLKCSQMTRDARFEGGDVLEIGAGPGVLSLWALFKGARTVVSLEPESHGSTTGVAAEAARHRTALGIPEERWSYLPDTMQQYKADRRFRMILSRASINHLDEDACERLQHDPDARDRYAKVFGQIRDALEPGGTFVFEDVGRENLWNKVGMTCPFAPEIEWHKHQEPEFWAALLEKNGFRTVSIQRPHPFYRLHGPIGLLATNRWVSRAIASEFTVTVRKA